MHGGALKTVHYLRLGWLAVKLRIAYRYNIVHPLSKYLNSHYTVLNRKQTPSFCTIQD